MTTKHPPRVASWDEFGQGYDEHGHLVVCICGAVGLDWSKHFCPADYECGNERAEKAEALAEERLDEYRVLDRSLTKTLQGLEELRVDRDLWKARAERAGWLPTGERRVSDPFLLGDVRRMLRDMAEMADTMEMRLALEHEGNPR